MENAEAVTADTPLRLQVATQLQAGEHVLPFAWDGEFFLPLDRPSGQLRQADSLSFAVVENPVRAARAMPVIEARPGASGKGGTKAPPVTCFTAEVPQEAAEHEHSDTAA